MTDFALKGLPTFPNGTVVKAYPKSNWPAPGQPSGAPIGAAASEQTYSSDGLTFSGLESGREYWAVANVGGSYRYVGFTAGADTAQAAEFLHSADVGAPGEAGKVLRANEQGAFFGRRLLRILNEGIQDASIVIVGDSTSASYSGWVGKVVEGLAARYPAYTVKYRDWTLGSTDYNAASTKQTGTGSKTLTVYNCAVASQNAFFQMAPNFDVMLASKQPDLIFFSHGHNHGDATYTPEPFWRDTLTVVTQSILRACPSSEIVLFAQNPRTDVNAGVHALRQFVTEEVAQLSGFGFLNVHRLFLDKDPKVTSLIEPDGIHPNATGYSLLASEVLRLLNISSILGSQQRNSLANPVLTNLLTNGDFASFASPPTLTGWTAVNALLAKDTTNFESPNGYSVRMTTTTPGSSSRIQQNVSGNTFRPLKGEWATFIARIRVPVGQSGYPGKISITENNGSHVGTSESDHLQLAGGEGHGQGDFRWVMCSRRIAKDCTNATFVITCEALASGDVSIDRAIVVPGIWPRDIR